MGEAASRARGASQLPPNQIRPIAFMLDSALRADDDMVVDGDLHVAAGFDQILGQADVLLAGGGVAAGVVVDDDDRGRAERDGARDHLADMDRGLVDASAPHRLVGDQHVAGVEEQDADLLDRRMPIAACR